jgi:hypothetical protein
MALENFTKNKIQCSLLFALSETLMTKLHEELHAFLDKYLPPTDSETHTELVQARIILSRGLLRIITCQFT